MLYGFVVRSPLPHADIISISIDKAKAMKGVAAVITANDVPGKNYVPIIFDDLPLLADKTVRFAGEPVALIAAISRQKAEQAAEKLKIKYKEKSAVLSIEEALTKKAPRIYGKDNIFSEHQVKVGSIEDGFNASSVVFEETFRTGYQEHAYIERQGMIAIPESGGAMTVIGSMQCPFYVHEAISSLLGIHHNKIKIIQSVTGGAFGGKEDVPSIVAGQAALLAYHTGKPVKLIYEREEDMISMSKRHPSLSHIKLGANPDGILQALQIEYLLDAGAYSTLSPVVLWRGTAHAAGPYRCSNIDVHSKAVATNLVPCGAFRGFGSPQMIFALESMIDILAHKLNLDPAIIRKRNILHVGDKTMTGHILKDSVGLSETMQKALAASNWNKKTPRKPSPHVKYGKGMACFHYGVGLGAGGKQLARAGADINVFMDGSVSVAVGNTEMGQGSETVLAQIAAEALNAPFDMVRVLPVDTTRVPDSGPTVASRTTVMSGKAVMQASRIIRPQLDKAASILLNCDEKEIKADNTYFFANYGKQNVRKVSFKQVVQECFQRRFQLSGKGWYVSPETTWDAKTGQGKAYMVYSFATIVAEVEVDKDTGEVNVLRITSAHDLGKAINPKMAEGQIEGGAIQGMSYALMEDIVHQNGIIQNPNFSTYILATSVDVPNIQPIIVEAPYEDGPYGAKGLGEPPLMGIAPAIANAIYDAIGFRALKIPIYPENIFIWKNQNVI